jgi:hypothetical protein
MRRGGLDPFPEKLFDECRITGGAQLPRRLLGSDQESARTQGFDRQRGGMWTRSSGAPLMIIEGILHALITLVHWGEAQGSGNGQAEESGHLIVDHRPADRVELIPGQNVQQGRAGDQALLGASGQKLSERLDAGVDDRSVSRWRQPTADRWIMIKMDPALPEGKARRQPSLVRTRPRTKINDLEDLPAISGCDHIVDQLGEEAADGGGTCGGVGGGAGGKPTRVDGGLSGRSRYASTVSAVCCHPGRVSRRASAARRQARRSAGSVSQLRKTAARLPGSAAGTAVPGVAAVC